MAVAAFSRYCRTISSARLVPNPWVLGEWGGGIDPPTPHPSAEATLVSTAATPHFKLQQEQMHKPWISHTVPANLPRSEPALSSRFESLVGVLPWPLSKAPKRCQCSCSAALASTRLMRMRKHHFVSGHWVLQPHCLPLFLQVLGPPTGFKTKVPTGRKGGGRPLHPHTCLRKQQAHLTLNECIHTMVPGCCGR